MTSIRIAVLGAGPAGLAAIHGLKLALARRLNVIPHFTVITADPVPSTMYGAQYLHQPIPGVTRDLPRTINYRLLGSVSNYSEKVYGPNFNDSVSPEDLPETHSAWDLRLTYQHLWSLYHRHLDLYNIYPSAMPNILEAHDFVVSSIPANRICLKGHHFSSQQIYAAGEAPEIGRTLPYHCAEFNVVCNGMPEPRWYRLSNIYGRKTVEWPAGLKPPVRGVVSVNKPLRNTCNCWESEKYLRVGRYGRWEKGVLVHQAFDAAYEWIGERLDG